MMMQAGKWVEPGSPEVVSHPDLMREMALKQAVLLGETHDRYDIHRWQLHVIASLHAHRKNIAVAFEMDVSTLRTACTGSLDCGADRPRRISGGSAMG